MTCELQFVFLLSLFGSSCAASFCLLEFLLFFSGMLHFWLNETEHETASHHISLPFKKQFFSLSLNPLKFVYLSLNPFEVWFQVFVD